MNKIFILTPYGNDYHTGHLVLLGPTLDEAVSMWLEEEKYLDTLPHRLFGFEDGDERYYEMSQQQLRANLLARTVTLPWETIDPQLSVPMVLADYSGSC